MIPTSDSNDHSAVLELVTMLLKVATDDSSMKLILPVRVAWLLWRKIFDVDSNTEMANHFNNISLRKGYANPKHTTGSFNIAKRSCWTQCKEMISKEQCTEEMKVSWMMHWLTSQRTRAVENIVTPNSDTSDRRSGGRDGNVRWWHCGDQVRGISIRTVL